MIQRLQCRDLYDLHELFVIHGLDATFVWPLFQRKARHRGFDPDLFNARFEQRIPQYQARWEKELSEHMPGGPPPFNQVLRTLRRSLRDHIR